MSTWYCQGFDVSNIGLLYPIIFLLRGFYGFSRIHSLSIILIHGHSFFSSDSCFLPSIFSFQLPSSTKCFFCKSNCCIISTPIFHLPSSISCRSCGCCLFLCFIFCHSTCKICCFACSAY